MLTSRFFATLALVSALSSALSPRASGQAFRASAQTLRGSRASVDLMYTRAITRDLQFLRTTADIYTAARSGALKLISVTNDLELDKATFPFVLPNTLRFADSLAAEYRAGCGERIVVTSGARPLDKQPRNASPKSVHPTGMAVDFRRPKTPACLEWLRKALVGLEDRGVVEATEEKHPPHFHVAVLQQAPEPRIQMAAGDVEPTVTDVTSKTAKASAARRAGRVTSSRKKAAARAGRKSARKSSARATGKKAAAER